MVPAEYAFRVTLPLGSVMLVDKWCGCAQLRGVYIDSLLALLSVQRSKHYRRRGAGFADVTSWPYMYAILKRKDTGRSRASSRMGTASSTYWCASVEDFYRQHTYAWDVGQEACPAAQWFRV